MTVITLFSGQKYVLIYQDIINIHLAYHGCKISLSRGDWPYNFVNILTTLKALHHQKKGMGSRADDCYILHIPVNSGFHTKDKAS